MLCCGMLTRLCSSSAGSVSSIVQVQLIVLCSRYDHYETATAGCNITFFNISAASSSSSLSASSPSSSSSPSSPSQASLDGSGSSLGPLAESPAAEAASPSPQAASQSSTASERVSFSGTVAFDRPVVGAQSLQSLAGMMYAGGVTNGRCAHAADSACNHLHLFCHDCHNTCTFCYDCHACSVMTVIIHMSHTDITLFGEHLLAGMMYSTSCEQWQMLSSA